MGSNVFLLNLLSSSMAARESFLLDWMSNYWMSGWEGMLFNYDDLTVLSNIPNMFCSSFDWLLIMGSFVYWPNTPSCSMALLVIFVLVWTEDKSLRIFDGLSVLSYILNMLWRYINWLWIMGSIVFLLNLLSSSMAAWDGIG